MRELLPIRYTGYTVVIGISIGKLFYNCIPRVKGTSAEIDLNDEQPVLHSHALIVLSTCFDAFGIVARFSKTTPNLCY